MNRKRYRLYTIIFLLLFAASYECCQAEEVATGSSVVPVGTVLIKFCIAMAAVGVAILIIWISLLLFKNYIKDQFEKNRQQVLNKDFGQQVKNVDEAIISFINKNKL